MALESVRVIRRRCRTVSTAGIDYTDMDDFARVSRRSCAEITREYQLISTRA